MQDLRLQLALKITDGDRVKAGDLLNLIDFSIKKGSKFPDVKMVLPEDDSGCKECLWYDKGECWVDAPDSVRPCKDKCSSFFSKKEWESYKRKNMG